MQLDTKMIRTSNTSLLKVSFLIFPTVFKTHGKHFFKRSSVKTFLISKLAVDMIK